MSSLEAWNNFLQEGFEILGDDFEPLKDYGEVAPTFARLTNEVIPLLTLESDLYAFVNGATLKEWREKYVEKETLSAYVAFQKDSIDILESDAMIMKADRARYARFLHGFVVDAIQEESVEFEDMLFEEQEVSMETDSIQDEMLQLKRDIMTRGMTFTTLRQQLASRCKISPKWVEDLFSKHTCGRATQRKEEVLKEMKYILRGMCNADSVEVHSEIMDVRQQLRRYYRRYSDMYMEVSKKTRISHDYVTLLVLDRSHKYAEKKHIILDTLREMLDEKKREGRELQTPYETTNGKKEGVEPMKKQEKTVQEGINTFASNLAKAVIKQLDVNELNAEIADAFTVVTNLKTSLSVAEKQLNTVKTVKDMLSKGNLTEEDIVLLTQYVDSMEGN